MIVFQAESYKPKTYTITNNIGAGWIILDVLSGLVGVIIDAATGSWYSLDESNINAVLDKKFFL